MELNKKKSGIVVFANRMAQDIPYMRLKKSHRKDAKPTSEWVPTRKDIEGVPLVNKYKYLGYYLDCKLTLKTQLEFIRRKSDFLFVKLYPYLSNASADGRRDMWQTMVRPLFNAALIFIRFEF